MPDILAQVWATPGLFWIILVISLAGIVRGFSGFGTALIFVPVAGIFLPPQTVIAVMALTGIASTAALIPRAWRQAARAEVGLLALAAMLTVPVGLWILTILDQITVRWIVAFIAGGTLAVLVAGWRFSGSVNFIGLMAIGAAAGVVGGMTGLTGPVVILFYLAGQSVAQRVRANTILFLAALDVVLVANLLFGRVIGWGEVALAITLAVPYFTTTMIGQALFDPKHERLYRWVAYGVIGLAVVSGLPLWT
ncbi:MULTISPECIES: sulfite exporter TauE/SafE family protein [unclassified Roseovarius]|uniref:sulfite exporter TauE/SafE family protein n=1 Tax=unclassified Roseovarius TaxID=2614913 RepID=UPI00273FC2D5|nr:MULTISPECIES: sulfite exporter TauE/SafE family protein [unclassified Roseovarius]